MLASSLEDVIEGDVSKHHEGYGRGARHPSYTRTRRRSG